jgi:hypothetical protein
MLEPRQMNEDGLDVREANHRMMNMLRYYWPSFIAISPSSVINACAAQCESQVPPGKGVRLVQWYYVSSESGAVNTTRRLPI